MNGKDLLCLEIQSCLSVYSAVNAIVRSYRAALLALDLTYPQCLAMMELWAENGLSVKRMGVRMHMDSGTTTPQLKRLEAKGLLQLTEEGLALKERAQEAPKSMACKAPLKEEESAQLKNLCDKLRMHLCDQ